MGTFWVQVGQFIYAIFFGAASGSSAAYVFAVNAARIGALALTAKLTQPKLDFTEQARVKGLTVRDTIGPQTFGYGEDMLSGPLLFANTGGTDNKDLYYCIALVGHECDSAQAYRVDSEDIPLSEVSGAFDGSVISGQFNNVMEIEFQHGEAGQAVSTLLSGAFGSLWTSAHTLEGWCTVVFKMTIDEVNEEAYKVGVPAALRVKIRLKKIYDPRLDDTNGGSGAHRLADDTTWTWSENPALALADFYRDSKFGMDEEDDRIDWPKVITAADVCDELPVIPPAASPSNTQKRYTINATFDSTQTRGAVRNQILAAMIGRSVFSQGVWMMWAGEAVTADVTLDETNLRGAVQLQASSGSKVRHNRVRGKFTDKTRDYVPSSYPEVRSSTYLAADNNEAKALVVDYTTVNNTFEAQRNAIVMLNKSRNFKQMLWEGNYSCFRIQPGATVDIDVAELGFAGEKFFVTEWHFGPDGVDLVLVEEDDTVWNDPAVVDYTTRNPSGVLTFADIGVPAPTSASVLSLLDAVEISWTNPPAGTFTHVEIHASDDNVRGNAVVIGESRTGSFRETLINNFRTRFYWLQAVNVHGQRSDFLPDLTTTTLTNDPLISAGLQIIHDPDFDHSTALGPLQHWDVDFFQTGDDVSPPDRTDVIFNSSGGSNGGAYVKIKLGICANLGSILATVFTSKRFRLSSGAYVGVIRYRRDDSLVGTDDAFRLDVNGYAAAAGGGDPKTIGSAVASDAFFPFPDGLLATMDAGATSVIQPGGSVRDDDVIAAADEAGIAMVFTGMRHFRH